MSNKAKLPKPQDWLLPMLMNGGKPEEILEKAAMKEVEYGKNQDEY